MNSSPGGNQIVFEGVSRFYDEVLGVNQVNLTIEPGITSLVGPNGSGKSTLMNLLTGLLRPTHGRVKVLGMTADDPVSLFRVVGYCTQYDAFPKGLSGLQFVSGFLSLHGWGRARTESMAWDAIRQVGLEEAAHRKVAAYSKGMRQRIKLAQAISHKPAVLVLDEPLNGLDPMARAETIELFTNLAEQGQHVIISSHILHEVDVISDSVVLLDSGYVVAEGDIRGVRNEVREHPIQILIRCDKPSALASDLLLHNHVTEVQIHPDEAGLLIRTRDAEQFYRLLSGVVLDKEIAIETLAPADEDVQSIYDYLIGNQGGQS